VGEHLAQLHRDRGVDLRTGIAVTAVEEARGRVTGVRLADGTLLPADDVLVAIGSLPNTEWLRGSGLRVADGIECDEYSAAAPGVYAAGDVARWFNPLFGAPMRVEHRTNAAEQGMAAARNLLRPQEPRPFAPVPYFWSDQYDLKVQAYGLPRGSSQARVVDGDLAAGRFLVAYGSGGRVTGVLGVGMPPRTLRQWRTAVAGRTAWEEALPVP
jgi:NADPH-dependent 2,4-dienoyl-CoA reductase/sulfur reductase-like enzyme